MSEPLKVSIGDIDWTMDMVNSGGGDYVTITGVDYEDLYSQLKIVSDEVYHKDTGILRAEIREAQKLIESLKESQKPFPAELYPTQKLIESLYEKLDKEVKLKEASMDRERELLVLNEVTIEKYNSLYKENQALKLLVEGKNTPNKLSVDVRLEELEKRLELVSNSQSKLSKDTEKAILNSMQFGRTLC
jgi:predicted nuclease with TOPRIM domain